MKPEILGLHHDHIDGSVAVLDVIGELYRLAGREFPFPSIEEGVAFMKDESKPLPERFAMITSVAQTRETLRLLAYAYGKRRAAEGFKYVEGKFAPQYHTSCGLSLREVAAAVYDGLKKAEKKFGIILVPVICIGREAPPELGVDIAKVAIEFDGEIVLDLACDEPGNPPEKHLPAFKLTFGTNVKRDCHAGEWVEKEPEGTYNQRLMRNIWTAIFQLRCHSISHAIPLSQDPELVKVVVDRGIRVPGCPLSNLRSGLIPNLQVLRIDYLLDQGVIYTLNADDDLFLPPMDVVVKECDEAYNFTASQAEALEANVWKGTFHRPSH